MKHFCRYKWGNHGEDFVFYEPLLKVVTSVIFRGKTGGKLSRCIFIKMHGSKL
jgi:hypothetical protein